jgi:hypothetical protein
VILIELALKKLYQGVGNSFVIVHSKSQKYRCQELAEMRRACALKIRNSISNYKFCY